MRTKKDMADYEDSVRTIQLLINLYEPSGIFNDLITEVIEFDEDNNTGVGSLFLIKILKMFGGAQIEIPSVSEVMLYKFLFNHRGEINRIIKKSPICPIQLIKQYIKLHEETSYLPEADLRKVTINFMKVVNIHGKDRG